MDQLSFLVTTLITAKAMGDHGGGQPSWGLGAAEGMERGHVPRGGPKMGVGTEHVDLQVAEA